VEPSRPEGAGGPPFAIGGPSRLSLDAARTGTASFTVSNITGRPVQARLQVQPSAGVDVSWFTIAPEAGQPPAANPPKEAATTQRAMPVAGTATVDVTVKVPDRAPAGAVSFVLNAALAETPDQIVSGPTVAFEVPAPVKRRFPWWILIVIIVALLILVGGGILIYSLTRPGEPEPTSSPTPTETAAPTPTERPILRSSFFMVDESGSQEDLDLDGEPDVSWSDTDLSPATTVGSPTIFDGSMRGAARVSEPTFEACRDVQLSTEFIAVAETDGTTLICVFTSEGHAAVLEVEASRPDETRRVNFTVWE
jgi:hypothetical protein